MRFYLPFLILLFAACSSPRTAESDKATPHTVVADTSRLDYAEQRRFDALFLEAIVQKEKENYDAAHELLAEALRLNPDAPEALFEQGQIELAFASTADTLQRQRGDSLLRRAIALAPTNADYKETFAGLLVENNRYTEAIALYKELCADHPTPARLTTLVVLQEQAADFAGAAETLERLEVIDGRTERTSVEKFKLYSQIGDNEHAYKSIEDLCAEFPDDLRYRVLLGDLYQQKGYHEMALAVYQDVLTAEPENAYAQISLLAYYKQSGQDSLYLEAARRAVLNPRLEADARVEAMRGYAADALATGRDTTDVLRLFSRALAMPQENRSMAELCAQYMTQVGLPEEQLEQPMLAILSVEPADVLARLRLLTIYIKQEQPENVKRVCHEGRLYDPTQLVFYLYEGLANISLNDYPAAIEALEAGTDHIDASTNKEIASDLYAALGDAHHELGHTTKAYAAYEQALRYNPSNVSCLNNYAYFLSLEGKRLDYAAAMSRRTVEKEPDNATYLDTYAWVLYRQHRYAEARTYIDRAIADTEPNESNASLFHHAGDIYYRLRQHATALSFWIKALAATPPTDPDYATLQRKVRTRRL